MISPTSPAGFTTQYTEARDFEYSATILVPTSTSIQGFPPAPTGLEDPPPDTREGSGGKRNNGADKIIITYSVNAIIYLSATAAGVALSIICCLSCYKKHKS
jgi:hypothetical protein